MLYSPSHVLISRQSFPSLHIVFSMIDQVSRQELSFDCDEAIGFLNGCRLWDIDAAWQVYSGPAPFSVSVPSSLGIRRQTTHNL